MHWKTIDCWFRFKFYDKYLITVTPKTTSVGGILDFSLVYICTNELYGVYKFVELNLHKIHDLHISFVVYKLVLREPHIKSQWYSMYLVCSFVSRLAIFISMTQAEPCTFRHISQSLFIDFECRCFAHMFKYCHSNLNICIILCTTKITKKNQHISVWQQFILTRLCNRY